MNTVIVPLDFSQTSLNAAHYAAEMFRDKPEIKIVLYHFYGGGEDTKIPTNYLSSLQKELQATVPNVETMIESGNTFIESLTAYARVIHAYMIVMGLTGKTPMAQRFSGSNTLKMAEKEVCPVLVVPNEAKYNEINNVLIASEMKYVDETPALLAVKRVLNDFRPFPV